MSSPKPVALNFNPQTPKPRGQAVAEDGSSGRSISNMDLASGLGFRVSGFRGSGFKL